MRENTTDQDLQMNFSIVDIEEILEQRYGGKPRFTWNDLCTEKDQYLGDLVRNSILVTLTYPQDRKEV